ncbi:hypothetical protein AgCh_038983 [Apium graveolens]
MINISTNDQSRWMIMNPTDEEYKYQLTVTTQSHTSSGCKWNVVASSTGFSRTKKHCHFHAVLKIFKDDGIESVLPDPLGGFQVQAGFSLSTGSLLLESAPGFMFPQGYHLGNNSNNFSVRSVLEKDKLTGTNFLDWQRNLRIILKQERKLYIIDVHHLAPLHEGSSRAQHTVYQKHIDDDTDVQCLMLVTMSVELQKQHENMDSYDMIECLKCQSERKILSKSNANPKPDLTKAFKPKGSVQKVGDYHYCKKPGHWKRNCHAYLEDLKKMKTVNATSDSIIYVIEVNLSTSTSWVLDTGCDSHICINMQELRGSRTLAKGEVDLRVGNGAKVVVLAVGTYHLLLLSGLVLELDNCFYVPAIYRNIIFGFLFGQKSRYGYVYLLKNKSDSFEKFKGYKAEMEKQTGEKTKGYSFYNPTKNKVFVARTAVFLERELFSKKRSGRTIDLDKDQVVQNNIEPELESGQDVHQDVPALKTQVVHRSSRARHELERYYGFLLTQDDDVMLIDYDEPLTNQEAMNSPD